MFSLPNLITVARLALIPFIVRAIMAQDCAAALVMLAIAGASDGLDGFLARHFAWQTRVGAYLDPLADKLMLTSVYVSLAAAGLAPVWLVVLIVGRDVVILSMVAAALSTTRFRDFPPTIWGKINTALEIFTALTLVTSCAGIVRVPPAAADGLVWITAASTAWSGIHYVALGLKMFIMRRTLLPADRRNARG
ncbi:MAG: CDP-alcohol phosphatidyltransferase family protein [Bryobacteraceae bacterium]